MTSTDFKSSTPGPWVMRPWDTSIPDTIVADADGNTLALFFGDTGAPERKSLPAKQHARLFFAAPDLLAALQSYVKAREHSDFENCGCDDDCEAAFAMWAEADRLADAAIAKATGETGGAL